MNSYTIPTTETLVTHQCGECGIHFAMPKHFEAERLKDRRSFYCPNGHGRCFTGESEADKLRRQLKAEQDRVAYWQAEERRERERAEHEKRRAQTARGQVTKIRNRVSKGVCPCCNRSFENLGRHMVTKHPEWSGEPPELEPSPEPTS